MNGPFAYAAVAMDASESTYVTTSREQAEAACREHGWQLVPLYAFQPPTDAEREAIVNAVGCLQDHWPNDSKTIDAMLGLMKRLGL